MTRRKNSILIAAGVMLVSSLGAGLFWRNMPAQKVQRLLYQSSIDRHEASLRNLLWGRSSDAIQADFDALGANAVPGLIAALDDADERIASIAAYHLGRFSDPRGVASLIKCVEARPVRVYSAFKALADTKDPLALQPLLGCLHDDNHNIAAAAALALGYLGDKQATAPLSQILADEEIQQQERQNRPSGARAAGPRATSAGALGFLGDPAAIDILVQTLEDIEDDYEVRCAAARSLGQLGGERAIAALTKATETPSPLLDRQTASGLWELKRAAESALQSLERDETFNRMREETRKRQALEP